jgi:hypothetical protein
VDAGAWIVSHSAHSVQRWTAPGRSRESRTEPTMTSALDHSTNADTAHTSISSGLCGSAGEGEGDPAEAEVDHRGEGVGVGVAVAAALDDPDLGVDAFQA